MNHVVIHAYVVPYVVIHAYVVAMFG